MAGEEACPSVHVIMFFLTHHHRTATLFALGAIAKQVGTYNPIANKAGIKEIRLKTDRLRYWISVGAQPSDRVAWILGKFGILPPPPQRFSIQKMIPKKDRPKDD